jgi:hypothetical protein
MPSPGSTHGRVPSRARFAFEAPQTSKRAHLLPFPSHFALTHCKTNTCAGSTLPPFAATRGSIAVYRRLSPSIPPSPRLPHLPSPRFPVTHAVPAAPMSTVHCPLSCIHSAAVSRCLPPPPSTSAFRSWARADCATRSNFAPGALPRARMSQLKMQQALAPTPPAPQVAKSRRKSMKVPPKSMQVVESRKKS